MKFINLLIIYSLFAENTSIAQCLIKGEVKNYDGDNFIVLQKPINNFFNDISFESADTIIINNNHFVSKISCNKPVFICISIAGQYINLIATPKDSIYINLDFSDYNVNKEPKCTFNGANAKGHLLFYKYNYSRIDKYLNIWNILKHASEDSIVSKIKNEIDRQLQPFRILYSKKEIEPGYYHLINTTITSLLLFESIRRLGDHNISNFNISMTTRMQIVSDLFKILSPYDDNIYYGHLSFLYSEIFFAFLRTQRLKTKGLYDQPDTIIKFNNKTFTLTGSFALLLSAKDKQFKEFLIATQIIDYLSVGGEEVLKDELLFFSSSYPNSLYISIIDKYKDIKKIERISAGANYLKYFNKISPAIIDTISGIKDFEFSNSDPLKDKLLFVDVWASWCIPCLQEMQYNYQIDSFLFINNIGRVYISIDNLSQQKKWKKLINDMHLGGFHILAGKELNTFLSKTIGVGEGMIAIPRYLIIKNDQILVSDAARPSDFNKLKKQLEEQIKN
jgi:thiol-disulfide isomerase/thioredoxin